jgi:exo-beta-1,3-glucanase (GH17 family)
VRVEVDGKFLSANGQPFRVRGTTYGSFLQRADGASFPTRDQVAADFSGMADAGLNTVRTYTTPPQDVLELAAQAGLNLIVGLSYDDWRMESRTGRAANRRVLDAGRVAVSEALAQYADRPDVMAIAVGNEVPADIVRLHGVSAVEEVLSELCQTVQASRTGILATYANFPTTEYLNVVGQDVVSFNVFREQPDAFHRYLRHLHTVAGDRPVLITELGLPAEVHGERAQADCLATQLTIVDETGCAGATIFSWTDDWSVNGMPVTGWGFGVTDVQRQAKPSLDAVRGWAVTTIRDLREDWPRVSVVVCAWNEEGEIERCLESLECCDYPELEVIFCDDGSTDGTLELARGFPFRTLALEHGGLSNARNAGLSVATGEIVAYLAADATCHQFANLVLP